MSLLSWWHFMHSDFVTMRILCFSGEWHLVHSIPTSLTWRACGKESSISLKNALSDGMTRAWHRVAQYGDGEARMAGFSGAPPAPAILIAAVTCSCPTRRIFSAYSMLCAPRPARRKSRFARASSTSVRACATFRSVDFPVPTAALPAETILSISETRLRDSRTQSSSIRSYRFPWHATQLCRSAASLLSPGNDTPDSFTSTDLVWHPLHATWAENILDGVSGTPFAPAPMYISFWYVCSRLWQPSHWTSNVFTSSTVPWRTFSWHRKHRIEL